MDHKALANQVLADIKNNNKPDAIRKLNRLLQENAKLDNLWGGLTRIALSIGEIDSALACANNYLDVAKGDETRRLQVASIYAEAGRVAQAIELFASSTTENSSIASHHFLGTVYSQAGELALAKKHLRIALQKNPLLGISWLTLSALKSFTKDDSEFSTLQAIESKMRQGNDVQNQIPYWFAYGKALLDLGDETAAFGKFSIGCQLMNSKFAFNELAYQQEVNNIIKSQTKQYFEQLPKLASTEQDKIIFIIGLPRSGTTLLQQILTSHSLISTGGESNNLALSIAQIGQDTVNGLSEYDNSAEILTSLQTQYRHLMKQRYGNNNFIIDKSMNITHHLGLLIQLFPHASFINITRDKTATAWSCYRNFFSQGLPWSFDIDNIKTFFAGEERLLNHWLTLFDNRICQITYEQLITQSEQTIIKCCQHIGVDYEPEMMSFTDNSQAVQTASVGQVRNTLTHASLDVSEFIKQKFAD